MMDMIEKVARAIAQDLARQDGVENPVIVFDVGPLVWSYVDQNYVDFGSIARAAIEAMREPTEAMEDEADKPIHDELAKQGQFSMERYGKLAFASCPFSRRVWQAMIDAALVPSPPLGEE